MKNKIFILIAVAALSPAVLSAQEAFNFMSFDIGSRIQVDTNDSNAVSPLNTFGINFRVASPLIVGATYNGAGNQTMFTIKYDVMPLVRAAFGFGSVTVLASQQMVTALGFEAIPFRRQVSGLFTEFKVITMYEFLPAITGIEKGTIQFGLALGVGF